jgi:hypothetical protein
MSYTLNDRILARNQINAIVSQQEFHYVKLYELNQEILGHKSSQNMKNKNPISKSSAPLP